ncbi:hypothetical protein CBM2634_U50027 [Cupriavidus taiwanensis]|uniref:Uncharacterized protein n=1 Tax=Cupriavidus taiwanensis TaxID=164546 RepID=A0A375JEE8_9BURK|nr:hypothetical protein CBM2634_U50027 [Cupriavidus taiwanensis]
MSICALFGKMPRACSRFRRGVTFGCRRDGLFDRRSRAVAEGEGGNSRDCALQSRGASKPDGAGIGDPALHAAIDMERHPGSNVALYGAVDEHVVAFDGSADQPFCADMDEASGRTEIAIDQTETTDAVIGTDVSVDAETSLDQTEVSRGIHDGIRTV